ncbi:hypothetical protein AB0L59_00765 [Streptomyces sp. NPDC052109]|uniref:hypothetical protein n=1 Tax=Streptomyces sp. NPDC052109 TaxID=3155527 RepID=UPI003446AED2
MRLPSSLSFCLAAAAVCLPVSEASAAAAGVASCVGADARAFPLATRIRGGPSSYEAGGGYGTWYIDLTNTTGRTCSDIHPVVVLVDDRRALGPDQPQLDFYDGPKPRPVKFESTDEQELVGVLDGAGFGGFTVPPGKTVSVKVRLMLPSDTAADRVTANAAVVQRRGDDGDWVGESNAYRFVIDRDGEAPPPDPDGTGGSAGPSPSGSAQATPGNGTASAPPASSFPYAAVGEDAGEQADELAGTGPGLAQGLLAAAAVLLGVVGGGLLRARRRR